MVLILNPQSFRLHKAQSPWLFFVALGFYLVVWSVTWKVKIEILDQRWVTKCNLFQHWNNNYQKNLNRCALAGFWLVLGLHCGHGCFLTAPAHVKHFQYFHGTTNYSVCYAKPYQAVSTVVHCLQVCNLTRVYFRQQCNIIFFIG